MFAEDAMMERRLGKWLPLMFSLMSAVDGWLAFGSVAQSTVMAVAVWRRCWPARSRRAV
jgi:hypothetical protein